jgi:dienelactone hydrolase
MATTAHVEELRIASREQTLAARLHVPEGRSSSPCVVAGQGWGLVKEAGMDEVAAALADVGIATVVFDYSHFGESSGQPRQLIDIRRQQEDFEHVIVWARTDPRIDSGRIGLWGYSFGGAHAVEVAARDPRIAAVVARAPYADGRDAMRTALNARGPLYCLRVVACALADRFRPGNRHRALLLPITGDHGQDAVFVGAEATGYQSLLPGPSSWRNEYAARVHLDVGGYRPVETAARMACPLLVTIGSADAIVSPAAARRLAAKARDGSLREYDAGHFDLFFGDVGRRVLRDEIDFLAGHLGRRTP